MIETPKPRQPEPWMQPGNKCHYSRIRGEGPEVFYLEIMDQPRQWSHGGYVVNISQIGLVAIENIQQAPTHTCDDCGSNFYGEVDHCGMCGCFKILSIDSIN